MTRLSFRSPFSLSRPGQVPANHAITIGSYLHQHRFSLRALLLILASMSISLAYVLFLCPLDLASDEAHYWDWSQRLDWSYYSKGPLVAWLIRGSCECFGDLSIRITGDLTAAIRLPAIICHGLILAGSYVLATQVLQSARLGLAVILVESTLPLVRVGSVLMTIDPPFLACWCWGLVCVWKATTASENRTRTLYWTGAGVLTAFGTLAKYSMALFPLAVVGFLLMRRRREFRRGGIWILLAVAVLSWLPMAIWNAQHGWVSVLHVLGQVGGDRPLSSELRWYGPPLFVGAQTGMLFGGWLAAFLIAAYRYRPACEQAAGMHLLWWSSVPVWFFFGLANVLKSGQPNWPAPAYLGGMILAIAWVRDYQHGRHAKLVRLSLVVSVGMSLIATVLVHFPGLFRPTFAHLVRSPGPDKPLPIRDIDLTARLVGWKLLAGEVDTIRAQLKQTTDDEPVLAATHWTIPGHLHIYCREHPVATSLGVINGTDRYSQYDLWRPNPVSDAQAYLGRTFVIVGELGPVLRDGFESIEPGKRVTASVDGIPVATWTIWVCHGFRGFAAAKPTSRAAGY